MSYINGISFNDELHTYTINGVVIPSVSKILGATQFKNKYRGVSSATLNKAATFGTKVHAAIENGTSKGLVGQEQTCYLNYLAMVKDNNVELLSQENMVQYQGLYCGTYDMIGTVDGKLALMDVKTTAQLDLNYLAWQLSYYAMAIPDKEFEDFYVFWIPKKGNGKFTKVRRVPDEELIENLRDFYANSFKYEDGVMLQADNFEPIAREYLPQDLRVDEKTGQWEELTEQPSLRLELVYPDFYKQYLAEYVEKHVGPKKVTAAPVKAVAKDKQVKKTKEANVAVENKPQNKSMVEELRAAQKEEKKKVAKVLPPKEVKEEGAKKYVVPKKGRLLTNV